jgi:hypothetical protein
LLFVVETGPIDVYDSEGEAVRPAGESGGDREVIDGVMGKLLVTVIPGSGDTSGGVVGRFENKRTDFWRKEGGGEERGDVVELGFLKKQDSGGG